MRFGLRFLLPFPVLLAPAALLYACSEDLPPARGVPTDASSSSEDTSATTDAAKGDSSTCVSAAAPTLDGTGPCGTLPFGEKAAPFAPTDAAVGEGYEGGVLAPGIYDVTFAERLSGLPGSWRETIVVGAGGKFTRVRQIDQKGDAAGEISYWSGNLSTSGGEITFASTCFVSGDAGKEAGTSTLPYDTNRTECKDGTFRYGATGIRVTLERR